MEREIVRKFLSGDGYGSGSGSGYGDGYGSGSGYGYGSGDGYGSGSGSGEKILRYGNQEVFYVDGLPCIFLSVHGISAKVKIISAKDFTLTEAYVVNFSGCFAHGSSVRGAYEDASDKYFSGMDFLEKKRQLLDEFKRQGKLPVRELYRWHGILTGSCRFGRSQFQKEHDLDDGDLLTLREFVDLTKNSFGGGKIKELLMDGIDG